MIIWKEISSPSALTFSSFNVSISNHYNNVNPLLQVLQTTLTHPERLEFIHNGLETEDYEYCVLQPSLLPLIKIALLQPAKGSLTSMLTVRLRKRDFIYWVKGLNI